ncbi:MAG: FkbM family methyltransferase [Pirellulales bacterium]
MKTVRLPDGSEVRFKSATALTVLEREFFADRQYEAAGIELRDGDVIFDVGANIGFFTLYLNRTLRRATVYCFEPIPETFELLRHNLAQTRLDVRLFNFGLADRSGRANFKYFPRMNVNSSMCFDDSPKARSDARTFVLEEIRNRHWIGRQLVRWTPYFILWPVAELLRRWGTKSKEVECELRSLSELIVRENVEHIDLLKIDVEGAEEAVLAGIADGHWARIRQVMVETHSGAQQAERVAGFLRRLGFSTEFSRSVADVENLHLVVGVRARCEVESSEPAIGCR